MNSIQYYITKSSIALQPYRALVGQSAAVLSIAQLLSPLFMFNSMRKAKSTLGMPFMPFLLIAVITGLNVRFSQLLKDDTMLNANLVGFAMSIVYMSIFYHYVEAKEKFNHLVKIVGVGAFIGAAILYSNLEDPEKVEHRFGVLLTGIMYCMFTMPFIGIYETFKTKCTRSLPVPMILSGTLVGIAWLLHGIIINSGFIIGQNLVMTGINFFQLSLFLIYPSEPLEESKGKKTKKKNKKE